MSSKWASVVCAIACLAAFESSALSTVLDAGDLNGDGVPDMLDLPETGTWVSAFSRGKYDAIFSVGVSSGLNQKDLSVSTALANLGDVDGDGRVDYIASEGNKLTVLLVHDRNNVLTRSAFLNAIDTNLTQTITAVSKTAQTIDRHAGSDIVLGTSPALLKPEDPATASACPADKESDAVVAVSSVGLNLIWKRVGPPGGGKFGTSVTGLAQDHNGDGLGDIAVSDPCAMTGSGILARQGKIYILSAKTGAILKEFPNPVVRGFAAKKMWFGHKIIETADLNGDGIRDLFVAAPASPLVTDWDPAMTGSVDLISGADGSLLCHRLAPIDYDTGFGRFMAGGDFKFGEEVGLSYALGKTKPHDLVISSKATQMAFVMRIDPKSCSSDQLAVFYGLNGGSRDVGVLSPDADALQPFKRILIRNLEFNSAVRFYVFSGAASDDPVTLLDPFPY